MTASANLRAQLGEAAGLIDGFRRSAEAGMDIDLTGLDRSVEAMCAEIARLPEPERPALKEALIALLDEMNALVGALEAQQREISQGLKGIASRQRAVTAYGKGDAAGRPGKRKTEK